MPNKSLTEQLEAKNHQTALNYLFDHIAKKEKVDEAFALKLHGILMNGIKPDAGVYRNHPVRITGVDLPTANYMSVPNLFSSCRKIKFAEVSSVRLGRRTAGSLLKQTQTSQNTIFLLLSL